MNILIVEDDSQVSHFLCKGLKESGYVAEATDNGDDAIHLVRTNSYHLVILDLMIKGKDGLEVLNTLRQEGYSLPILILSAKRSIDDKVFGLQHGADDYLVKPFSFAELLARVQVLLKRTQSFDTKSVTHLSQFGIELDLIKRQIHREGRLLELQPKEFALLEYFMRNPDRVLSKTMILESVYGYNFDTQTNVVDVLVSRLRNKIDRNFKTKTIHTIRGVGYVLKEGAIE